MPRHACLIGYVAKCKITIVAKEHVPLRMESIIERRAFKGWERNKITYIQINVAISVIVGDRYLKRL